MLLISLEDIWFSPLGGCAEEHKHIAVVRLTWCACVPVCGYFGQVDTGSLVVGGTETYGSDTTIYLATDAALVPTPATAPDARYGYYHVTWQYFSWRELR